MHFLCFNALSRANSISTQATFPKHESQERFNALSRANSISTIHQLGVPAHIKGFQCPKSGKFHFYPILLNPR